MSSQKRIDANRRNAQRSTGPKTPQGKAAASRNALKHGLLAQDAALPCEDQQAVVDILIALEDDLHPVGALEEFLVHQMASAQWRLQRVARIETGMLESSMDNMLSRADNADDDRTPQEQHRFETVLLGNGLVKSGLGADLWNLTRYENAIRRSFYKALAELRQSQKLRASQPAGSTGIPACVSDHGPQTPDQGIGFVSSPPSPGPSGPRPASSAHGARTTAPLFGFVSSLSQQEDRAAIPPAPFASRHHPRHAKMENYA